MNTRARWKNGTSVTLTGAGEQAGNPIDLLNAAGFFDPLLAWVDRAVAEDFFKPACRGLLLDGRELEPLLDRFVPLLHAEPPIRDVPPAG